MKILILTAITFLITTSCDVNDPKKDNPKPEGYQEDIPWPSLADSPWPIYHHDPQFTGRSKYAGPISGNILWELDSLSIETSVVLGLDSTVNFLTSSHIGSLPGGLYNVNLFTGKKNWIYKANLIANGPSPLVTADGTIIISTYYDGKIFAISKDGLLKWSFDSKSYITSGNINIDLDGNLYFADSANTLYALNKSGTLGWKLKFENTPFGSVNTYCPFAPDGKTIFVSGYKNALYAIDIESKSVKWFYQGEGNPKCSPIVDAQSNIYLMIRTSGDRQYLVKVNSSGKEEWRYYWGSRYPYLQTPCIDKFGNIVFGFDSLYSVDYKGKLRWKVDLNEGTISSPVTCDINGTIYLGLSVGDYQSQVAAFSSLGNLWWKSQVLEGEPGDSPAIQNGLLLYPTYRSKKMYAIK
ncbi:MAG: hypothetical protein Fur0023_22450 [Bacteroidia bacterium]